MKRPGSKIWFLIVALCIMGMAKCLPVHAQKRPLGIQDLEGWPNILQEQISNDGRVVAYNISTGKPGGTTVLKATDNSWEHAMGGTVGCTFTQDSRYAVYRQGRDSIVVFDIAARAVKNIFRGNSFKMPAEGNARWLAYISMAEKTLTVHDLGNSQHWQLKNVTDYTFSGNGDVLLVEMDSTAGADTLRILKWINIAARQQQTIASGGKKFNSYAFGKGDQLAFTCDATNGARASTLLRYFKKGMDSAIVKAGDTNAGLWPGYILKTGRVLFNTAGDRIFFTISTPAEKNAPKPDEADLNLWHYADRYLPTEKQARQAYAKNYLAVIPVNGDKMVQLSGAENLMVEVNEDHAEYVIVRTELFSFSEWPDSSLITENYLVNTSTGEKKLLVKQRDVFVHLSPSGKYAYWYDPESDIIHTCEIASGKRFKAGRELQGLLRMRAHPGRLKIFFSYGIAGWLPGDSAMLVYDQFDVYKIDPRGKIPPVNITNGFGRKNNTVLRIWSEGYADFTPSRIDNSQLLLTAFDLATKQNGFYSKHITATGDPQLLVKDDRLYFSHPKNYFSALHTPRIQKAKKADVYILRPQRANEFPNIAVTRNFKKFLTITDLHPEKKYNWFTTELISWKTTNGKMFQGVLYKPENFDATKKYPVLIYFYELLSYRLHAYLEPELSGGTMNIPFFASNDYLVFTPDIEYAEGKVGDGAVNSVLSAAAHLAKMSFVDSTRMGIQGHSFGGYQVNYLVANSSRFAAAQESAGSANFLSHYNSLYRDHSAQFYFERGQARIGTTIWKNPELFINNSPIFKAPKVTTPLLIMHNRDDGEVPFNQGIEWFTALKRLGKKVWMLQYDKEHHGIDQRKNKLDFTTRQFQFFEHYLKNKPAPAWMVKHTVSATRSPVKKVDENSLIEGK